MSQLALEKEIAGFILDHGKSRSLLIVHYGRHGDNDDDKVRNRDRQSVWAA